MIKSTNVGMRACVTSISLLSIGLAGCVTHSSASHDGAVTLMVDNDVFTGSDNNYTNGIGVAWTSNDLKTYDEDRFVRKWGKFWSFLPFVSKDGYDTYAAWSVAQEINTPDEIDNPNPPEDDQPYSGVLYLDSMLYARGNHSLHTWSLRLGVVGPAAHADDVQKWYHDLSGNTKPEGWHTQLPNEPVVNVDYNYAHLLFQGDLVKSASWRIVPVATGGVGTYFTGAGAGMYGEVGWNLVDAFGGTSLRAGFENASTVGVGPVRGWSVSLSGGVVGYGILHYLPLDGTVFRDSRSVDTEPFVGEATFGINVRHRSFTLSFLKTYFTDAFETERENAEFGTVSVSWFF